MKCNALVRWGALVLVTSLVTGLVACDRLSTVRKLTEVAKPMLKPELISMQGENLVPGSSQLVLLVGENHASVKTQQQLATIVAGLLDARLLDAVLLEGTNGPVDANDAKQRIATAIGADATLADVHWREQLDGGLLAGYEFVALTRPSLDIFGVEDMGAKARNASALEERGLIEASAMFVRGADLLDQALAGLHANKTDVDLSSVDAEVAAARQAAQGYATTARQIIPELAPLWRAQEAVQILQDPLMPAIQRLYGASPSLMDREKWVEKGKLLTAEGMALAKKLEGGMGSEGTLPANEDRLGKIESELETIKTNIDNFDLAHAADLAILTDKQSLLAEATKRREEAGAAVKPSLDGGGAAANRAIDAYFIAANSLRRLAPQGSAASIAALHSFFRDEAERARLRSVDDSELLAERDAAMAKNTVAYLQKPQNHDKKVVILVVGYAHVAGIEKQLAASHVSYLSGMVASSKAAIEPWEEEAWGRRHRAGNLAFASGPGLKETSQLLNELWKTEQVAKVRFFNDVAAASTRLQPSIEGLAWDSRIFESVGNSDRALRVGKFPFDRGAAVGAHVLDRGPVPGKSGEFFELTDRQLAGQQAVDLSDNDTQFVFFYKTVSGDQPNAGPHYRFKTSSGDHSFDEFQAEAPGNQGVSRRVVMFGESDEVMDGDVAISPLWKKLHSDGADGPAAGGAGKPPIKPPSAGGADGAGPKGPSNWWAVFPFEQRKTKLLRTINPERARLNLHAIDRQEAQRLSDIQFLTEGDIAALPEKLLFTPERGDNSQIVVLMGHNVAELRAAVRSAGEAKLLKGKQVALVMCGDSFGETAALRENLLREGALMVWTNDRQVTEQAGQRLLDHVKKVARTTPPEERKTIDELMGRALQHWRQESPFDRDIASFMQSAAYVLLERPESSLAHLSRG